MICFDTNIIIYIANGTLGEDIVGDEPIIYPSIVFIESLGYPSIKSIEEQRIRELCATLTTAPLADNIIESAIKLRQDKKMSLGDSIVAATALENNSQLWTVNTRDFEHIEGLDILNPLQK
jgi:predicted nucleic acid-binding protein